jgi:tRNA 2-thiouridine synthesizing protein A
MKIDVDMRGRACPIPIVELMKALRECTKGDVVEVRATDRAFPLDVASWCKKTGHTLVSFESRTGEYVALVKKP